jgi:hypothetical protein
MTRVPWEERTEDQFTRYEHTGSGPFLGYCDHYAYSKAITEDPYLGSNLKGIVVLFIR